MGKQKMTEETLKERRRIALLHREVQKLEGGVISLEIERHRAASALDTIDHLKGSVRFFRRRSERTFWQRLLGLGQ